MKTIAQFVKDRITALPDMQDALQTAMQLEFSTIPPYLCAQLRLDTKAESCWPYPPSLPTNHVEFRFKL